MFGFAAPAFGTDPDEFSSFTGKNVHAAASEASFLLGSFTLQPKRASAAM